MGDVTDDAVRIKDIWYPDAKPVKGETDYLFARRGWLNEALAIADSAGLVIVADIHSHPDCLSREPSEADWDASPHGWLQGICTVNKTDNGGRRASVRFWPSIRKVVRK